MLRNKITELINKELKNMTWSKAFDVLEDRLQLFVLEKLVECENYKEDLYNDIVVDIYSLKKDVENVLEDVDFNDMNAMCECYKNLLVYQNKFEGIITIIDEKRELYMKKITVAGHEIKNEKDKMYEKLKLFVNNDVKINKLWGRFILLDNKLKSITLSVITNYTCCDDIMNDIDDDIKIIQRILDRRTCNKMKEYEKLLQKRKQHKKEMYKIFDYKKMNKLAKELGYVSSRDNNGDHKQFTHKDTNKTIPIPQKTLGSGISFKIQKEIFEVKSK